MQTRSTTRDEAAEAFVRELINHVVRGMDEEVIRGISLPSSPSYDFKPLQIWFNSLDAQSQKLVKDLITYAVDLTVFSTLNVLDGTSGAVIVPGKDSEEPQFAECSLSLELYPNSMTNSGDAEPTSIKISHQGEDLHDIFANIMNDEPHRPVL